MSTLWMTACRLSLIGHRRVEIVILGGYPALMASQNLKRGLEDTMAAENPLLIYYLNCRIWVVKHLQHG